MIDSAAWLLGHSMINATTMIAHTATATTAVFFLAQVNQVITASQPSFSRSQNTRSCYARSFHGVQSSNCQALVLSQCIEGLRVDVLIYCL